jgi:hypothetical protein
MGHSPLEKFFLSSLFQPLAALFAIAPAHIVATLKLKKSCSLVERQPVSVFRSGA